MLKNDEYNRDGGVTAILRYTLRLLTTQQRDRITKMILAAELIRQKEYPKYGKEPISIGFWVGGTVTPNTFKELEEAPEDPAKTRIASLCCFCTNQIFNFFSCNTAVFQCILKNE